MDWERGGDTLLEKLEGLRSSLLKWAREVRIKRKGNVPKLTRKLELLMEKKVSEDSIAQIIDTKLHLNLEIDNDERYWKRARVNWLKVRDKNSAFFHKYTSSRKSNNHIRSLQRDDERETMGVEVMDGITRSYFQSLFTLNSIGDTTHIF